MQIKRINAETVQHNLNIILLGKVLTICAAWVLVKK